MGGYICKKGRCEMRRLHMFLNKEANTRGRGRNSNRRWVALVLGGEDVAKRGRCESRRFEIEEVE
jgi:hypothetical protein